MGEGKKRCRLDMSMKPVPTIFDASTQASSSTSTLKAPIRIPQKSSSKRNVFADECVEFVNNDKIIKFESIDETLAPSGYTIAKYEGHIVFYKIEHNELLILQVTECIRVDDKLHVKLYFKFSPVLYLNGSAIAMTTTCQEKYARKLWFVKIKYIFDELKEVRFKMSPVYAPDIVRFVLMLRYTSVQSYKLLLDEFRLASLSLLWKIVRGDIDTAKSEKLLKDEEKYQVMYVSYLTRCICKSVQNIREVKLLVRPQMVNYTKVLFLL